MFETICEYLVPTYFSHHAVIVPHINSIQVIQAVLIQYLKNAFVVQNRAYYV